jgi:hypothetical protein
MVRRAGVPPIRCATTDWAYPVRRPRRARNRRAFTLLEVLITAILLATLLVGVWSLYRTFASLYESGFVQTERALVSRSLSQQFSEDLMSTLAAPPAAPGGNAPADRFASSSRGTAPSCSQRVGLVGTYNTLRLDILQTEPPGPEPAAREEISALGPADEDDAVRTGEIVTVLYSFVPPAANAIESAQANRGLTRREIRLNQSSEELVKLIERLSETNTVQYSSSTDADISSVDETATDRFGASARERYPRQSVMTYLPEVTALEFRYFDGSDWTDAWDSRTRGTLPKAVEMSYELQIAKNTKPGRIDVAENQPPAAANDRQGRRRYAWRFVVYLPQAASPAPSARAGVGSDPPLRSPDDAGSPPPSLSPPSFPSPPRFAPRSSSGGRTPR